MKPRNNRLALSHSQLTAYVKYDENTGFFWWREPGVGKKMSRPLGNHNGRSYVLLKIKGVSVLAHRLAWFWQTGAWPLREIDHINRNPADNRICNLREASRSQNRANQCGWGSSGVKGVRIFRGKPRAEIKRGGKTVFLGVFDTVSSAKQEYDRAAKEIHGSFAGP